MTTRTLSRSRHTSQSRPLRAHLPASELCSRGARKLAARARQQEATARQLGEQDEAETYNETAAHLEHLADLFDSGKLEYDAEVHAHLYSEGLRK